jgi:type II secretory pathway component PulK
LDERDKLHFVAEAAVKKAIVQIRKENLNPKNYYASNSPLGNNGGAFRDIEISDAIANICYNYGEQAEQEVIRYGLSDEERKININEIDSPVLERLFRIAAGSDAIQAQELAASIIDWRDKDSVVSIPSGSAEDQYYRTLDYPYEAGDGKFEVLEEVLLVKGMSEDIFTKIKKYITIYGDGRVNINTASGTVLLALGLSPEVVDKILNFRYGEDELEGTTDGGIFDNLSEAALRLNKPRPLTVAERLQFEEVCERYLNVNSHYFRIEVLAKLKNRKNTAKAVCIAGQDGKILSWQEP